MSKDKYNLTKSLKSETILAVLLFIPLLFTITGIM